MNMTYMKATDLMIGDWVLINNTPHKIQAIDSIDAEIQSDDELYYVGEDRHHSEDKIEGIPITPEILEKNGWHFDLIPYEKDLNECCGMSIDKHWCYADTNIDISLYFPIMGVEMGRLDVNNHHLKRYLEFLLRDTLYVHEMQNNLRLCGLNEIADNFKV